MLKLIIGIAIGLLLVQVMGAPLPLAGGFALLGLSCQLAYARALNSYLRGADPVREFGARSLNELKAQLPVPMYVTLLDIAAKSCGYAMAVALLQVIYPL